MSKEAKKITWKCRSFDLGNYEKLFSHEEKEKELQKTYNLEVIFISTPFSRAAFFRLESL